MKRGRIVRMLYMVMSRLVSSEPDRKAEVNPERRHTSVRGREASRGRSFWPQKGREDGWSLSIASTRRESGW